MIRTRSRRGIEERIHRSPSLSPEIEALADRVRRLVPSHRDPEQFHVEKDGIERELRGLAQRLRRHNSMPTYS